MGTGTRISGRRRGAGGDLFADGDDGTDDDALVDELGDVVGEAHAAMGGGVAGKDAGVHALGAVGGLAIAEAHEPAHGRAAVDGTGGGGVDAGADAGADDLAGLGADEVAVEAGAVILVLLDDLEGAHGGHAGALAGGDGGVDGDFLADFKIRSLLAERNVDGDILGRGFFQHARYDFGRILLPDEFGGFFLLFGRGGSRLGHSLPEKGGANRHGHAHRQDAAFHFIEWGDGYCHSLINADEYSLKRRNRFAQRHFMKFPIPFLLIMLLGAWSLTAAPKETPTPPPPPMPQDQSVSIYRGRTVEIPLRAIGRSGGQLKFIIRVKPKSGKLGEIRFTGSKSAVVTYTHNDSEPVPDTFTYAVQNPGSAVSAPGRVNIAVSEDPPAFSVVRDLNFDSVMIGEPKEEQITIRNSGGGMISGKILAPAPWKVIGKDTYQLGRKEEKQVRVIFDPTEPRDYTEKLVFSHDARSPVTLTGRAVSPFEFEPGGELTAKSEGREKVRMGGVTIRNVTDRERVVDITMPTHLSGPDQVTVGAGGEARVPYYTTPEYLQEVQGEITLESEGYRRSIPVNAPALAAILEVEPKGLNFGEIGAGQSKTAKVEIRNVGGTPARLKVTTPPDVLLTPDANSAVLEPGGKLTFQATLETQRVGTYQFELDVAAENVAGIRVPVDAMVNRPVPSSAGKVATSSGAPQAPEAKKATPESELYPSDVPKIEKLEVRKVDRRVMEVSWKKPAPNAEGVVVEQRMIGRNGKVEWKKLQNQNIKVSEKDDVVTVRLQNLALGQLWFLRFSSLDHNEHQSVPSEAIRIATEPPEKPVLLWVVVGVLALGIGGFLGYKAYQARKVDAVTEAGRMARIEGKDRKAP